MSDADFLTPLQLEAAELLARGESPTAVRSQLELPQTTFAAWREDDNFADHIQAERNRLAAEAAGTTEQPIESGKLRAAGKVAFRKNRR